MIRFILILLIFFCTTTANAQRFSDSSVVIQITDSLPQQSYVFGKSKAINWNMIGYEKEDGTVKRITGGMKDRGDAIGIYSIYRAQIDSTLPSGKDTTFVRTKRELVKVILKKQTDKLKPGEVNEFIPKAKK